MRIARKLVLAASSACAIAVGTLAATSAHAGVIQLGFILDRSGSIGGGNWTTIVNGLSSAVNTLIPADGTYEISVVTFSSSATINVDSVLIDSVATRSAVATAIAGIAFTGGGTVFAPAFSSMQTALGNSTETIDFSYVNFATDGVQSDAAAGLAARNALITAGVDNISIEGIGSGIDASDLQNNYCYPGPCDTVVPYNFPAQGFYIGVADAAGYAAAIGNKIRIVTGQVPEPASLALLGLALAGLAATRRRAA